MAEYPAPVCVDATSLVVLQLSLEGASSWAWPAPSLLRSASKARPTSKAAFDRSRQELEGEAAAEFSEAGGESAGRGAESAAWRRVFVRRRLALVVSGALGALAGQAPEREADANALTRKKDAPDHSDAEGVRRFLAAQAEQLRNRFGAADPAPQWQGCYRDSREARLFSEGPRAFGHSSQACAAACTGHRYFALQGGGQCFCGRTLGRRTNHSKLPDAKCGQVCPAEEGKEPPRLCGAGWRNAVYAESRAAAASAELLLPPPPPPPPPPSRRAKANASTPSPSHHARSKHRAPLTSHGGHASAASHHKHTSSTSRHNHKHTASTSSPSRGIGTLRH